jgi:hypothetical protein
LLLAALTWGSTAEFTHHHGSGLRAGESQTSTRASADAEQSTATKIQSSDRNGSSSNTKKNAECLICQLHQNLSATAIGHTHGVGPTQTVGLNAPPNVAVELSEFTSTGNGRAPPSLL